MGEREAAAGEVAPKLPPYKTVGKRLLLFQAAAFYKFPVSHLGRRD